MKKLLISLSLVGLLIGCEPSEEKIQEQKESHEIIGSLEDVKIVQKEKYLRPVRYQVVVAKGDQKLNLLAHSEQSWDALTVGLVVDIKYSKDYHIEEIKLHMGEDKDEN
jgi:hypothetical protein